LPRRSTGARTALGPGAAARLSAPGQPSAAATGRRTRRRDGSVPWPAAAVRRAAAQVRRARTQHRARRRWRGHPERRADAGSGAAVTAGQREPHAAMVVMKFGGTSVKDAQAMRRVAGIVARETARSGAPIVVVSAMSGVTDQL